ncbi:hypothetical protein Pmani_022832 [Petrolisthes manimaculis]|uniref:Uncharacterized protein n=1 Tax=Petrolisthes manimaculis TaxID=1843537 RepID=A0AAE1PC09_9EUCA|nr:hypothetical protein Pmani_022832 [Petrolisthes manimaculis]
MGENFVQLRWNDHQSAILGNLSSLRDKQVLTDVTLSCGDEFYPAHRFVLSSCSSFLARALEVVNCPSPVLLLHGISQCTLQHLLVYMYDGQITVSKDDLPQLLKAAHWLGVKGLESTYNYFNGSVDQLPNESNTLEQETSSLVPNFWREMLEAIGDGTIQGQLDNIFSSLQNRDNNADDQCSDDGTQIIHQSSLESGTTKDASVSTRDISVNDIIKVDVPSQGSGTCDAIDTINDSSATGSTPYDHNEDELTFEGWKSATDAFPQISSTVNGQRSEKGKRSLRCKSCKRSFAVRSELAKHLRVFHDSTHNFCFRCSVKFDSDVDYLVHMESHNTDTGKWLHCSKCNYVVNSKKLLAKHMESHEDDINHLEASVAQLMQGIKTESNEIETMPRAVVKLEAIPIVKCSVCYKAFKSKAALWKHKNKRCYQITKSENGFHCPLCNFNSKYKQSVQVHLGRHTTNKTKSLNCSYCSYHTKRLRFLREHISKAHPERRVEVQ